jgi:hypothetical protein
MKIHLTTFLSSLLLFSLGTCTNASQPNTLRCETEGFLPNHTSCGVMLNSDDEGDIFNIYFVVSIAFNQNSCASPTPLSMLLALSIKIMFILSTNPFCCGVYGAIVWHDIFYTTCIIDQILFHIIHHHFQLSTP